MKHELYFFSPHCCLRSVCLFVLFIFLRRTCNLLPTRSSYTARNVFPLSRRSLWLVQSGVDGRHVQTDNAPLRRITGHVVGAVCPHFTLVCR